MQITKQWLLSQSACLKGIKWFEEQAQKDGIKVVKKLMAENKILWANWLIVRIMDYRQYVSYGVYAAEQVIDSFEIRYPRDKRPRKAIEAARKCLEGPSQKNKSAVNAAYAAVYDAEEAAEVKDEAAAEAAEMAAYAAAAADAEAAEMAAEMAAEAIEVAAYAEDRTAEAEDEAAAMKINILNYGLGLLVGK